MKRRFDWRYLPGAALLLAAVAALLAAFSLMSHTDMEDHSLADAQDARLGWSYELLADGAARAYEPRYGEDGYIQALPEGTEAVRIRRTMAEEIPGAELQWYTYLEGVEVRLDGELLHSDFPEAPAGADGYLHPGAADWERIRREQGEAVRRVRMTLPADYAGRELCVTTYFPEGEEYALPAFPRIGTEDSEIAGYVVGSLKRDVLMTIYALLTLMIAVMYLLDIPNGGSDAKTLLLSFYFLLTFFNETNSSFVSYFSRLYARVDLRLLYSLSVAPLYLYLALRGKRRWRIPLCAVVIAWTVYEGARWMMNAGSETAVTIGPASLIVFLAVGASACADAWTRLREEKRHAVACALVAAAAAAVYVYDRARAWGSLRAYLADGMWTALRMGNFGLVIELVTDLAATVVLIAVISEFVRRTLRARQEMGVLQDRAWQTMESYQRLLTAQDATNVLRHEMRHHMIALSGILGGGDAERAKRYVDAVAGDLDRLPVGRYSQNLLVNVVAGSFLDRAQTQGIRVEHRLNVPPELNIADEDLSVFLSNMLQNALEACERMAPGSERYIRADVRLRGNFLFVKCVNSAPKEDGPRERPGHGYGLAAMRRIADKYNSTLLIERAPGTFSVMSDLYLRKG